MATLVNFWLNRFPRILPIQLLQFQLGPDGVVRSDVHGLHSKFLAELPYHSWQLLSIFGLTASRAFSQSSCYSSSSARMALSDLMFMVCIANFSLSYPTIHGNSCQFLA